MRQSKIEKCRHCGKRHDPVYFCKGRHCGVGSSCDLNGHINQAYKEMGYPG